MTVKEIMHAVTIVKPKISIYDLAKQMSEKDIGSVLVKIDELQWGIVTERDILNKVVAKGKDCNKTTASEVMVDLRYTIDSQAKIEKASEVFNIHPIRRLPVMEDGEIVGIVTARDVAKRMAFKHFRDKKGHEREAGKKWR